MDPCVLTNLRKMLPLWKGFDIHMKASIDLLFIYIYYALFVYATLRLCILTSAASPISPSVCLALLQEPASSSAPQRGTSPFS